MFAIIKTKIKNTKENEHTNTRHIKVTKRCQAKVRSYRVYARMKQEQETMHPNINKRCNS